RMRQAVSEMVGVARGKNLSLGFQPPEGSRVNNAISVTRVRAAVGMYGFGIAASTGEFLAYRPGSRSGNLIDGPLRSLSADRGKVSPLDGSGFRECVQTPIGLFRNSGMRKFLLQLLIDAGGFPGIRLAKHARKFEQDQGTRHERRRFVGQSTKDLDGILRFVGAGINDPHLILRHGGKLFIAPSTDFPQLFKGL